MLLNASPPAAALAASCSQRCAQPAGTVAVGAGSSGACCAGRRRASLLRRSRPTLQSWASPQDDAFSEDISDNLKQDLARFKKQQDASDAAAATSGGGGAEAQAEQGGGSSPLGSLREGVDKVLIADFFLVLVALAWLGVGVLQAKLSPSDGGSSPLLDLWYPLWPTLWQSAIGLLMAGALVSGGLNWVSSNFGAKK